MNIFVCVRQVPDTETKVKPNGECNFIETTSIKWIMNPYDEFAVEQALLLKEVHEKSTVTALRVGDTKDSEVLRTAMAMGADESILVKSIDNIDSYMIAKALKGAIEKSGKTPDVIFTGKQAIDDDCLQVPQLLATFLNIPSVSVVVGFDETNGKYTLKREIEGGTLEIYEVNGPILISCNKGLNTPRYASLPGIMKAKKKPFTELTLEDVNVKESDRRIVYSEFHLPPEKPPGKKFEAMDDSVSGDIVKEVVQLLRNEAKII